MDGNNLQNPEMVPSVYLFTCVSAYLFTVFTVYLCDCLRVFVYACMRAWGPFACVYPVVLLACLYIWHLTDTMHFETYETKIRKISFLKGGGSPLKQKDENKTNLKIICSLRAFDLVGKVLSVGV